MKLEIRKPIINKRLLKGAPTDRSIIDIDEIEVDDFLLNSISYDEIKINESISSNLNFDSKKIGELKIVDSVIKKSHFVATVF